MPRTVDERLTTAALAEAANTPAERREEREARDPAGAAESRTPEENYAGPLLPQDICDEMRHRWESIQTGFVDDPRVSVQHADELVANAIKKLAESFAQERARLEQQWSKGSEVSTEDLRQALQRYRAFFHRLLSL